MELKTHAYTPVRSITTITFQSKSTFLENSLIKALSIQNSPK